jgi:hypothetical protein
VIAFGSPLPSDDQPPSMLLLPGEYSDISYLHLHWLAEIIETRWIRLLSLWNLSLNLQYGTLIPLISYLFMHSRRIHSFFHSSLMSYQLMQWLYDSCDVYAMKSDLCFLNSEQIMHPKSCFDKRSTNVNDNFNLAHVTSRIPFLIPGVSFLWVFSFSISSLKCKNCSTQSSSRNDDSLSDFISFLIQQDLSYYESSNSFSSCSVSSDL